MDQLLPDPLLLGSLCFSFELMLQGCFVFVTFSSDELSVDGILFSNRFHCTIMLTIFLVLSFVYFSIVFLLGHLYLEGFHLFGKVVQACFQ